MSAKVQPNSKMPNQISAQIYLPYRITQCYLSPETRDNASPNPSQTGWYSIYISQRDGRLSWTLLGGWVQTEMVYQSSVTNPNSNAAWHTAKWYSRLKVIIVYTGLVAGVVFTCDTCISISDGQIQNQIIRCKCAVYSQAAMAIIHVVCTLQNQARRSPWPDLSVLDVLTQIRMTIMTLMNSRQIVMVIRICTTMNHAVNQHHRQLINRTHGLQ